MRTPIIMLLIFTCHAVTRSATPEETQKFLRGYRHSWCPYALPSETTLEEIEKVAELGFDTVGVSFVGPYNGGDIDFTKLDEAVDAIGKHGQRVVLHISPRFLESEGVSDRLDNGRVITNVWNRSPNYCMLDIFNPTQRTKSCDWIGRCARRYGKDKRIAAFVMGWGYMGETGFYNGDFLADFAKQGSECAGYSPYALAEFNKWRASRNLPPLSELPLPSVTRQSDDYILFHRFRCEFVRNVFHKEMIAAAKAHTQVPVGTFAYISASPDSYARNWTDSPNADFYRSAGSASSFDMSRTLIDSGVGWEDAWLHDSEWGFTAASMQRDEARQIARGGVFHAMHVRVYETEPQWEKGVFRKVARFLKTQDLEKRIRRPKLTIALYQPTWGAAAFPARSESQKFLPKLEYMLYTVKMIGLVESFGLPYRLVTEAELLDSSRLKEFEHIIVPMWDLIPRVVGESRFQDLSRDQRVVKVPLKERPLTRTEFRELLRNADIKTALDFDSNHIVAGRFANLIYNWSDEPIRLRVPEQSEEIELGPNAYRLLPE